MEQRTRTQFVQLDLGPKEGSEQVLCPGQEPDVFLMEGEKFLEEVNIDVRLVLATGRLVVRPA